MYGIYNGDDYKFFENFEPFIIALWRGTDALITNEKKAAIILAKKNCKHYAASSNVKASLARWGIRAEVLPITSTDPKIECEPRGKCVYCYISSKHPVMYKKYKMGILKQLERSLPYKFIYTTIKMYPPEKLMEVYKRCFVGVRLLDHDGMSNSILEMGLMGRRTISNSGLPYTIRWKSVKDIRKAILKQYATRNSRNKCISDAYRKLIDIGDNWLEI
jgi:hypothetical protein